MVKLLRMFVVLVTIGFITPSIFSATTNISDTDITGTDLGDNLELKDLEDELRRLLESEEFESEEEELATPEAKQVSEQPTAPETIIEEKETLEINPPAKTDEGQKLVIEYEPMTIEEKKEFDAQPGKKEVIILDEVGEE